MLKLLYGYLERWERTFSTQIPTQLNLRAVKEGDSPLELGNYLGDLTDKLVLRVKGITQTHQCSECINFDRVKELVDGYL
ncbi:hypothetical protein L3Q82_023594, partial [Scortum barcoo]